MTPTKVLIAGDVRELPPALDRIRAELPEVEFEVSGGRDLLTLNGHAEAATALVVEIDLRAAGALNEFRQLAGAEPARKVIAAARNASADDVRKLFRAGAADVLTSPFTPESVANALNDIIHARAMDGGARGAIVTMLKTNGGVGSTTIGLNLAGIFAKGLTKGVAARSAALLDLDLQFGDAEVALNLEPKSTMMDVLRHQDRFDRRFLAGAMVDHASGLKLLAAPPTVVPLDAMPPAFAVDLVEQSAHLHDVTIVDLPRAWTDWSLPILKRSSLLVLAASPTVQGALGARRVLDALRDAAITTPVMFVLNKMAGVVDTFEKPTRISRSLQRPVDAALSLDSVASRAMDRGDLLVNAFPNSRLARISRGSPPASTRR